MLTIKNNKMKRILLVLLAVVLVNTVSMGQGIYFDKSYESALAKAKKWERGVFIDVMTSWCGPCKQMEKNVFPQIKVGQYFNNNYVSLKIDADKGEGPMIAKKYGVNSYPTLIFLDKNGNFVHKVTGGLSAERLIHEAKQSSSPEAKKLRVLTEKYKSGDMDDSEILDYLKLLKQVELDCSTVFGEYFKGLSNKEKRSLNTFTLMRKYITRYDEYPFGYLINNYKKYRKIVDRDELDQYMYSKLTFATYVNEREGKSNALMYKKLEEAKIPVSAYVKENYALVKMVKDPSKRNEFIERGKQLFKNCKHAYSVLLNEAVKEAISDKKLEAFCKQSLLDFAKLNKTRAAHSCTSLAYLFILNARDNASALKYYELAVKIDPNVVEGGYVKSNMDYCKKSLGLVKCDNYGETAPAFTLMGVDGESVSLNDYKGKLILIDFWASWCGPCIGEIKYLKEAYAKHKNDNIEFISISTDKDKTNWKKAINKHGMSWLQLLDDDKTSKDYKVRGIPRIMLIGKDGKIVADELRGEAIEREIKKVL